MKEVDQLFEDWKKITVNTIAQDGAFIHHKNESIMDAIIKFENEEKQTKVKQKQAAVFAVVVFAFCMLLLYLTGQMTFSAANFIGFTLLIGGLALAIIGNQTDNFPDARVLSTRTYLQQFKDHIQFRKKRHLWCSVLSLFLIVPGIYLAWSNVDLIIGSVYLKISLTIGFLTGLASTFLWFRKYNEQTKSLTDELETLVKDLD